MSKLAVNRKALIVVFVFLFIVSLGCLVNTVFFADNASETWIVLFICALTVVVLVYLLVVKPSLANYVIAAGLVMRVGWLLLHSEAFFTSEWVNEFFYFGDGYHKVAAEFFSSDYSGSRGIGYDIYPHILSFEYHLLGASHLLAGWFNTLMFLVTVVYIKRTACILGIRESGIAICVLPYSILPFVVLFTTGTFRENVMVAPLVMSLYFMLVWMKGGSWLNIIGVFACVVFVCIIHAGYFPALAIYAVWIAFYDKNQAKLRITLLPLLFLAVVVFMIVLFPEELRWMLFAKIESLWRTDILTALRNILVFWQGGSAYLGGIEVDSYLTLLWYVPLKFIYFFISPVPFDWRGFQDAATFWADSVFYILLGFFGLSGIRYKCTRTIEWWILLLLIAGFGAVFAMGTVTAGTAIRHRLTILPFLSILAIYTISLLRQDQRDKR